MFYVAAQTVEIITTGLAIAGLGYFLASLVGAYTFLLSRRAPLGTFAPDVSILKSLKGVDASMMEAFRSHCRQDYAGEYELLFGVASLDDPAAQALEQLQREFPERSITLIECPLRLGTNGKVSTLIQLVPHARFSYLLINDSDIHVSPRYLKRVMSRFEPKQTQSGEASPQVGMVTALYRGRAHGTIPSRMESLGIATDFQAGVLLSRMIEGGLHYGLGSTLAVSRVALEQIGGLEPIVDHLADDYELGARIDRAGFRIELCAEAVETSIPAYDWRGFFDHQLRWARTVRDARPWGYAGLIFTHGVPLALLNVVASGLSPVSFWILALSFFLRMAVAMAVGATVLNDHQVLPQIWLLPLRDCVAIVIWAFGFAGNTIVWRGERFELKHGKLTPASR